MTQHRASVVVGAPAEQVFALWSHFNDYPKFMTYVHEVTYLDGERSHWVVDMVGRHEWDAVNEGWVAGREIGWRSTSGLTNRGRVRFEPQGAQTLLTVEIAYEPPAGPLGALGDALVVGGAFDRRLQHDLDHFAEMVRQAPPGALDPTSSAYLFHRESAASRGATTPAQNQTMGTDGEPLPEAGAPSTTTASTDEGLAQSEVPPVPGTTKTNL